MSAFCRRLFAWGNREAATATSLAHNLEQFQKTSDGKRAGNASEICTEHLTWGLLPRNMYAKLNGGPRWLSFNSGHEGGVPIVLLRPRWSTNKLHALAINEHCHLTLEKQGVGLGAKMQSAWSKVTKERLQPPSRFSGKISRPGLLPRMDKAAIDGSSFLDRPFTNNTLLELVSNAILMLSWNNISHDNLTPSNFPNISSMMVAYFSIEYLLLNPESVTRGRKLTPGWTFPSGGRARKGGSNSRAMTPRRGKCIVRVIWWKFLKHIREREANAISCSWWSCWSSWTLRWTNLNSSWMLLRRSARTSQTLPILWSKCRALQPTRDYRSSCVCCD